MPPPLVPHPAGKKQKKGHAGGVTDYMGRTRAIKKLQITIKDFRCVVYMPRRAAGGVECAAGAASEPAWVGRVCGCAARGCLGQRAVAAL